MEPGQFVTRYNHMLHPLFGYHHQVSDAPADVVSAHGQSKSCEQEGMKQREAKEEKRKQEKKSVKQAEKQFINQLWTIIFSSPTIV